MKNKLFVTIGLCLLLLTGCAGKSFMRGLPSWPECNAQYVQEAKLVSIANKYQVCLRDVGNGLIVANEAAIGFEAYEVSDASVAVFGAIQLLKEEPTELLFQEYVMGKLNRFPGLLMVGQTYIMEFNTDQPIDQASIDIIIGYLENKVMPILELYEKRLAKEEAG